MNSFFSSIVTNLKILEYTDNNATSENTTDGIIKIILKYRNHPSILTIGEVYKEKSSSPFSFLEVCEEDQLVFCQMYQTYLKGVRLGKYQA